MKSWHTVVTVTFLNYLLLLALGEVADLLAPFSLGLRFEALLLLFPALYLPLAPGLVLCLLLAFLVGAHHPVPLGWTLLSFFALWHLGLWMRTRLRRDHGGHLAGLAATLQALVMIAWSAAFAPGVTASGAFWSRVLLEIGLSAAVVALLAGFWCHAQARLLEEFGWQPVKL